MSAGPDVSHGSESEVVSQWKCKHTLNMAFLACHTLFTFPNVLNPLKINLLNCKDDRKKKLFLKYCISG